MFNLMRIVGVTGCKTGIAQSRMGAESLELAVEDFGDKIELEVHGSAGTEDTLENEDVNEADVAIVASDISVDTERFEGMPSIHTDIQAAVTDAEQLIERAEEAVENGEEKIEYEANTNSIGIVNKMKGFFS